MYSKISLLEVPHSKRYTYVYIKKIKFLKTNCDTKSKYTQIRLLCMDYNSIVYMYTQETIEALGGMDIMPKHSDICRCRYVCIFKLSFR